MSSPFDWPAEPFLTLYAILAGVVFVAGFFARSHIGGAAAAHRKLTALEIAYLAGGAGRAGDVALLCLVSSGAAYVTAKTHKITVTDAAPLATISRERASLSLNKEMSRRDFLTEIEPLIEPVRRALQSYGYHPTDAQMNKFRLTGLPFVAALFLFGLVKVFIGSSRHHPVGFLLLFLGLTVVAGFLLASRPLRTRAGAEAVRERQAANARAARAPLDNELMLAVALTGAVVLSGTAYASIYEASKTSGGDGGGGCGGGGGGCGGGGCGGCS